MKTYPILDNAGRVFAFEISNTFMHYRRLVRVLKNVKGVADISSGKMFGEVIAEFKYKGTPFIVWEPYGDNSRYWIGPKEKNATIDASALEEAFRCYRIPPVLYVLVVAFFLLLLVLHILR